MGAQVRAGNKVLPNAGATPRATEKQKIERKRINIVIKVYRLIFDNNFVFGVHNFSTNVNFDLTNVLN